MPAASPYLKFVLRASTALIVLSAIWWFVLLDPLLFGFRQASGLLGSIIFGQPGCQLVTQTGEGNWQVCLPADRSDLATVSFELARSGPAAFTFGLPVYWAVLLGFPLGRESFRALLLGTGATAIVECLLLLLFLRTYAYAVVAQPGPLWLQPLTKWFLDSSQYLELSVLPALTPFGIAIWFSWERIRPLLRQSAPDTEPATPAASAPPGRRLSP